MSATVVQLSDVIIPEVYLSYTSLDLPEKSKLVTSGLAETNSLMNQIALSGGKNSILPFWKDLDPEVEPNYSNDDPEDLAEPASVTTGEMNNRKAFVNKGFSEMDLVQELAGASPMTHIRSRFSTYWERQKDRRAGAILRGLYVANKAKNASDMSIDITSKSGAAGVFGSTAFIDAVFTKGDEADTFGSVIVHSIIMRQMVLQDDIVYVPDSEGKLTIPTYKGLRVVMVDSASLVTGSGTSAKFLSVIFGRGAFGFGEANGTCIALGEGRSKVPIEVERNARAGNGGGQETLWERKTWVMHPFGFNWTDPAANSADALTEFSPKLSDLRKPGPWTRVVDRKNVPLAFVESYGYPQA